MALELPTIPTITSAWNWSRDNIRLWLRVVGDLKQVLADYDLDQNDTLVTALQFSLFCIVVAFAMGIPYNSIIESGKYSISWSVFIINSFEIYLWFLIFELTQKLSSTIMRGHGSIRASFVLTIFGSGYIIIAKILP